MKNTSIKKEIHNEKTHKEIHNEKIHKINERVDVKIIYDFRFIKHFNNNKAIDSSSETIDYTFTIKDNKCKPTIRIDLITKEVKTSAFNFYFPAFNEDFKAIADFICKLEFKQNLFNSAILFED